MSEELYTVDQIDILRSVMKRRISNPVEFSSPKKQLLSPTKSRDSTAIESVVVPIVADPHTTMTPLEILESITMDPSIYRGNIRTIPRKIEPRESRFSELTDAAIDLIDKPLWDAYADHLEKSDLAEDIADSPAVNIHEKLYCHQVEVIESILVERNSNICISTSTSSGKSLAFNLPVLSELIRARGEINALYLYPTKALTQDQKRVIDSVIERRTTRVAGSDDASVGIVTDILDGDVKDLKQRREILNDCNLVLSNPDMLHFSILPNHTKYASFFAKLRFVVIDEAHCYNGAFGSHVASLLRRLRRVVAFHQQAASGDPNSVQLQFISCSATIGNPAEHVSKLVGIECDKLVTQDGSPSGERLLTVWNSASGSSVSDTVDILIKFLSQGVRFICFCKVRFMVEHLLKQTQDKLNKSGRHELAEKIVTYRAGYSAQERRVLESRIFAGHVLGVVATSALELGMDIGSLDVALTIGFPGSVHSLWQQWGRAGRGTRSSLCMLIAREEDILDSYLSQDVDERLLQLDPEDAVIQAANANIVKGHMILSDLELRMRTDNDWQVAKDIYWPECDEATFKKAKKEAPFAKKHYMSIRNAESRKIEVRCDNHKIDEYDMGKAFFYVYPGAVLTIQGTEYKIVELSVPTNTATAVKSTSDYFTVASDTTTITPRVPPNGNRSNTIFHGPAEVVTKVRGYTKINKKNPRELSPEGYEELALPAMRFPTNAFWLGLDLFPGFDPGAIHGAVHSIFIGACQRLLLSSRSDIKCDCARTDSVLIYDAQVGGLGAAEMIFSKFASILNLSIDRMSTCTCTNGCLKCLYLSNCPSNNENLTKNSTIEFLKQVRDRLDSIQ